MDKRILVTVAHPDDEAFGPGGTIARYASEGAEIHILCATKGESGQWHEESKSKVKSQRSKTDIGEIKVHHVREEELKSSARILGATKVEFMDFIDGMLCNNDYHKIADKIIRKINSFQPQILITLDRLGVSGHLDHIAVSLITTYAFLRTKAPKKLYYEVMSREYREKEKRLDDYFIYFPEGYGRDEITTTIDYTKYLEIKKNAMYQHKSQMKDVLNILKSLETRPKEDYYILGKFRKVKPSFPEADLFCGM